MLRNIIAGVLGLIVAWILFTVIQATGYLVFPPSVPLDANSALSIKAYMDSLSSTLLAIILVGYAIGSFVGGLVIGKVAEGKGNLIPIIAGAVLTLGWILNLVMLPYPIWVAILGFFMFIPFTILGKTMTAGSPLPESGAESEEADAETSEGEEE